LKPLEQHEQFEHWIRDYAAILHHVARGFADGDDRQDLMQELLLAVWKAIPSFRNDALASTFLYRVSHNAALTWKRSRNAYQRKLTEAALHPPPEPTCGDEARLDAVYREIRKLPPLDRSLMLLSLDGVSYREMAAIHGLTETNVGARLNRTRQKLTSALKGTEPDEYGRY
jgi:RNA polymerase sigma factor (sigma-70 family)